ncbi:MAG: hypothetical protein ABSH49_36865 [Bryobacteraceae bacterium]|jgi:hypothetical protein
MPDWMKQAMDNNELGELKKANAAKDQIIAQLKIRQESPEFWKQLLEKLALQVAFLHEAFGLDGSMNTSDSANGEILCSIDISWHTASPRTMYVNLFYRPGGSVIRYWPQFGEPADLPFGVVKDELVLFVKPQYFNSEQAATQFVRDMVRIVKPDALQRT